MTGSLEAGEDVVQDVFLKVWVMREKLGGIMNFNAYLHRMIHNEACNTLERVAREGLVVRFLQAEHNMTGDEPDRPLLSAEIRRYILQLTDRLTPRQREIFLLSREEGLKYEEIAQRLGIGFETVKTHLAEALKFLRAGLIQQYGMEAIVIIVIWQLGIS